MASTCALGPWQCIPGPVFTPVTLIKIGYGDEVSTPTPPPHTQIYNHIQHMHLLTLRGHGVFVATCTSTSSRMHIHVQSVSHVHVAQGSRVMWIIDLIFLHFL